MPKKVWTAAELERLSPVERRAIFEERIVDDLDEAPRELLERSRARIEASIAESANRG